MQLSASRPARGITLVELLVVIAMVGIVTALAAPSLSQLVLSNRAQAAASEVQAALMLARAEAVKRGADSRVAIVANAMASGSPPAADWKQGVSVFLDANANANGNAPPSTGTFFLKTAALDSSLSVNSNVNGISFNGMGRPFSSTGAAGNGTIAVGASGVDWRCIIVSATGRIRVARVDASSYTSLTSCPTA